MEHSTTELVTHLVLQLGVILLAAKIAGEITERVLKQPGVIGELAVGMLIGPYALGGMLHVPHLGALFPRPEAGSHGIAVSLELYAFATVASIVLLFLAGLETDLQSFLRYGFPATLIGLGGVILPFVLGVWAMVQWGLAPSYGSTAALFIAATMVATSVGITARVLSDIHKLDTPEGVTILGAAVVDDILGIIVLTIVLGISDGGGFQLGTLAGIGVKVMIFLGIAALGVVGSKRLSSAIRVFESPGARTAVALSLCLLFSAFAEVLGLAMIIGAYFSGLALSSSDLAEYLREKLSGLYAALVPIFFVVMGMLVDVSSMKATWVFGLILSGLAVVGKVVGCGLPSLATGFNRTGALRVGIGMLPRGEVALIIAGVGIARGAIAQDLYGIAVLMTLVTTVLAPIALVPAFRRGGSGRRRVHEPA